MKENLDISWQEAEESEEIREKKDFLGQLLWGREEAIQESNAKKIIEIEATMEIIEDEIMSLEIPLFKNAKEKILETLNKLLFSMQNEIKFASERLNHAPGKLSKKKFSTELKEYEIKFTKIIEQIVQISEKEYLYSKKVEKIKPSEYDGICIDNTGLEEHFDLKVSYVVNSNIYGIIEDNGFIEVYNRYGDIIQVDKDRFKLITI